LIQRIRSAFYRAPAAADAGFAMLAVIGYGMVIVLIASLVSGYALNSMKSARREQDFDGAVSAAQAGVDSVVNALRANPTAVPALPSGWVAVPGSKDPSGVACDAHPTVPVNCPQYRVQATPDGNGDYTVYAAGKVREGTERAVKVTIHKSGYTDYLYYSEVEAADPADSFAYPRLLNSTGGPADCAKRAWGATSADVRPASVGGVTCKVPAWRDGDSTDGSTVHSNDVFTTQGSPTFDSLVTTQYDKCLPAPSNPTPTCYLSQTATTPNFDKGKPSYASGLVTAPTDLKSAATCVYTGPTRIQFVGDQMRVWSPQTLPTDNAGNCGGGMPQNILDQVTNEPGLLGGLISQLGVVGSLVTTAVSNIEKIPLTSEVLGAVSSIATQPPLIPIPAGIYVQDNTNPVGSANPAPTGLYCLLGKTLGFYGTLDPDPATLLTNALSSDCSKGSLYVDGAFNGRSTIGTDGDITITSDIKYSDAAGNSFGHDKTTATGQPNALGLVANGSVLVWNPLQCTLALATCLSLLPKGLDALYTPLKALGGDIEIDAAIMSMKHHFGMSFPLLQPAVYLALLNKLATVTIPIPKIKLYGSVAQYYRGALGAQILGLDVSLDNIDVANANINIGYYADYDYDQHLRTSPPPNFPQPATPTWVQDTFAEIPVRNLPAAFSS
jgi:hypothetical protein